MSHQLETPRRESPDAVPAHPQVLYVGLQKTGSEFLRAYFSANPEIIWTREAGALLSADRANGYLDAARKAYARARAAGAPGRPPVWIDMFESLGLAYRFLPGREWQAETMLSNGPLEGNGFVDPSPPAFFESLRKKCPHSRVLLTIRKQADWLFSNYHHYIHHLPPGRRSFPDFLQTVEGRILSESGRFDRLVEKLHAAFGRESVFVVPLEAMGRDADAVLRRLCEFLGCRHVRFVPSKGDFNRGMDFRRAAGRSEIPVLIRPPQGTGPFERLLYYLRFAAGRLGPEKAFSIPSKAVLAAEYGPAIAAEYADSNRRLAALIGWDLAELGYPL